MPLSKNTIITTLISFILILGFLFLVYMLTSGTDDKEYLQLKEVKSTDHVKWSKDKKHILVEYSDLQCPSCKYTHEFLVSNVEATQSGDIDITKKITFVYRHFPLDQHQNARKASYAAEAAGRQGKFFEMINALFDKQTEWSEKNDVQEYFTQIAKNLKLDVERFKKDMDSQEVKDKVNSDFVSGQQVNVNSTPTFYLNGRKVTVRSFDEFKKFLIETSKQ